jgi:hypothetical protein
MDSDGQAKALRLRLYFSCPECARLIDLAEGNQQHRHNIEGPDLVRHFAEEHATWLEVIGIRES